MAPQTTRRSDRILAQSTAANKQAVSSPRPTAPSKPTKSSTTRCLKRKAPATEAAHGVSATKASFLPVKRRRLDASGHIVRSEPDPQYLDTDAIAKALEQYLKSGRNPLRAVPVWGKNPFREIWKEYEFPDPKIHALPALDPVEPLKRLSVRYSELSCVEVIRDGDEEIDDTSIFRVKYKGKVYILKLFRSSIDPCPLIETGPQKLEREKRAYERLLHHGVCSQGFVPMCHGWFELPIPKTSRWLRSFVSEEKPPCALLIEDISDGATLSIANISPSVAGQALLAADHIHKAGVLHRDLRPRNTLVRRDGTVVIIDFDKASTWPDERVDLLSLKNEMQLCWSLYFNRMLTDRWTGLTQDEVSY
ncbi:hypothetical protein OE88DRAFT_1738874 [Heliocybe sulcata]|uniref:Protein kinase domain-containing protein n=1 Tax=Heliocybe sulcata TaxID=5364 RepID=A0A5C3MP26_9AGAM|nr:hypothetical protein OE88DRAFT_1738874 [Heliocybe sulcata]